MIKPIDDFDGALARPERYGVIWHPADPAVAYKAGTFLWFDGSPQVAKLASAIPDIGSEALNQETFHDFALGVCLRTQSAGEFGVVPVARCGRFWGQYRVLEAAAEVGDTSGLVGVDEAASGTALTDEYITSVATTNLSVGKLAMPKTAADWWGLFDLAVVCSPIGGTQTRA